MTTSHEAQPAPAGEGTKKRRFYGWYIPAAAFVMMFMMGALLVYGFSALLPAILEDTGWSRAAASGVYGLLYAEIGLMAPLYGMIITKFGARLPMAVGSVLGGVGLMMMSRVETIPAFYITFAVATLGLGIFNFGPLAVITNWFHKRRALAMGIFFAGTSISGLSFPLYSALIAEFGWRGAVSGGGVAILLICIPLSFVFRYRPEPYGYAVDGESTPETDAVDKAPSTEPHPEVSVMDILKTLPFQRAYWLLVFVGVAATMGFGAMLPHLLVHYGDVGIPESVAVIGFAIYAITSSIGRVGGGYVLDRQPKRIVIAFACAFLAIGLVGTAHATTTWHLVFFVLFLGPAYAVLLPAIPSLTAEVFGAGKFAMAFALVMLPPTVIGLVGPAIAGWLADVNGSYQMAFYLSAAVSLIGIPLVFRIPSTPVESLSD
ncbi:MFS transporter [Ruegeria halocynthiae]|uniref:MFS transporter n=1 Tax=Ruegeria halocynthiae TaxID=985054 RepID=UPI00056AEFE5|nr:MFS transporter [Ruegeria halocynthiae]